MGRGIENLHPELVPICNKFVSECKSAGLSVLITETFRTVAEQDALYAQGRTTSGSIVTNCKGTSYQSPHQWGCAFDICKNVKGQEYSDNNFFTQCGVIGEKLGLAWGGRWTGFVDKPHFELPKYLPNNSTTTLKNKYGTPDKFKTTWATVANNTTNNNVQKVDDEVVDKTKVILNGKEVEVERIFKNDTNYIKLRDLEKLGLVIDYDAVKKMPIINTK